jgi:hypothetical protein
MKKAGNRQSSIGNRGLWRTIADSRFPIAGVCLVLACTDPRARPIAPQVLFSFAPSFILTSPGAIIGSLYMYDVDGLRDLELKVAGDSLIAGDSTILLTGDAELTRPINWTSPAGIATGTQIIMVAKVSDFTGFVAVDTVRLTVSDSTAGLH